MAGVELMEDTTALPAGHCPHDRPVVALSPRQRRMVERFCAGFTPRCSVGDFNVINGAIPGVFQHESRDGADVRAGYVLTSRTPGDAAAKAAHEWLRHNAALSGGRSPSA